MEVFLLLHLTPLLLIMILSSTRQLAGIPKRIISLVPSQTELLYDLDLDVEVTGITKFCIHPNDWFTTKIRIGGTKNINIKLVHELKPDLIIANTEENVQEQIEELGKQYPVWVTDVQTLEDALQMIEDIGELTQKQPEAAGLVLNILNCFEQLQVIKPAADAAYLIWKNPYMTIGGDTFINDMMQRCGLNNIFADKKRYPKITTETLQESNCQLLLLSSEPYPFQQKDIDELAKSLAGCKICLVNGEYFSWYGSRLVQAPAYFKELLKSIYE